jgi:hypothetical protein
VSQIVETASRSCYADKLGKELPRIPVDAVFSSPSAAASIVAGYPSSGPQSWVDQNGVSLKSLLEKEKIAASSE